MLGSALEYFDYTLEASDGEIGSVQDLYFDEPLWTVRYLVVRPTDWYERPALFSAIALRSAPGGDCRLAAELKLDQLKSGPAIGTAREITRTDEALLHDHHGWPHYWQSREHSGQGAYITKPELKHEGVVDHQEYGPESQNLRSMKEMVGCRIQATEGEIGSIVDLMVDGGSWRIRYLVVDIASSWFSKKILVSPDWVVGVDWMDRKVVVELSTDEVKNSPEPHEGDPIEHESVHRLNALWALPTYFS